MIAAAMKIGRSKSGERHRGKGMDDLLRFIELVSDGSLLILSGKGKYLCHSVGGESHSAQPKNLGGTFIEWRISGQDLVRWQDP